jgi:hypothetical protein
MIMRTCVLWFVLCAGSTLAMAQSTPVLVAPGVPQTFDMAASSATTSFAVDVPGGTRSIRVALTAANPSHDVDLLIRYSRPFELRSEGGVDDVFLFDQAQYRSASAAGDEYVVITDRNPVALTPGRWHIALINYHASIVNAQLSVSFDTQLPVAAISMVFDDAGDSSDPCDISGWNDATAATPVRGNSGSTLGAQRRLAAQEAARLLTDQLKPRVPVRVRGCWKNLGEGNSLTLAQAGPNYFFVDDLGTWAHLPGLERGYTWFAAAAAAQQVGTTQCRIIGGMSCATAYEVDATFNTTVDGPNGLGARGFDYGFTQTGALNDPSFVTVTMHEIAHGLGFVGLINTGFRADQPLGSKIRLLNNAPLYDDAYGAQTRWTPADVGSSGLSFLAITDEQRVSALTSLVHLRFAGENAIAEAALASNFGSAPAPDNFLWLYAPSPIEGGSSYSHVANSRYTLQPQMMLPGIISSGPRDLGVGKGVLKDVGWRTDGARTRSFSEAPSFQYFDPTRSGHGIDFRRISPALVGVDSEYFLGFYSYDAQGKPEWYVASGPVIDGVFVPKRSANGDSLLRMLFTADGRSVEDASPSYNGQIRIDFNDAQFHPACADGNAARRLDGPLAVMSYVIGGESGQWCMQPVVIPTQVQTDVSSIWADPGEAGWGIAMQSFDGIGGDGLFTILFYPDQQGLPRWGISQAVNFTNGTSIDVMQVNGYCRSCPMPAEQTSFRVGSLTLNLVSGGAGIAGSRVTVDASFDNAAGGSFRRTQAAILSYSDPTLGGD